MPNFRSLGDLNASIDRMGRAVSLDAVKSANIAMAKEAQRIAKAEASADLGGDPKFSGWAPPLDTQIRNLPKGRAMMTPTRTSAGPWTTANQGRNRGHTGFAGPGINRRTGRTAKSIASGSRKVRVISETSKYNGVTPAFRTADRTVAKVQASTPEIATRELRRTISKYLDIN